MGESHVRAKLGPSRHHTPEALQAQQQRQMAQAQAQQQGRESQLSLEPGQIWIAKTGRL